MSGLTANPNPDFILQYESIGIVSRLCVPGESVFAKFTAAVNSTFGEAAGNIANGANNYLSSAADDLRAGWALLLIAIGISVVVSIVYLCLLKCCAGVMVWFSLFGAIIGMAGLGAVLFIWSGQLSTFSTNVSVIDESIKQVSGAGNYY